jgi:hypothetical protein
VTLSRIAYRSRQFWSFLTGPRSQVRTETLLPYLAPSQIALFCHMRAAEQVHGFHVFEQLKSNGQSNPDLLAAALLHDVGKIMYPPTLLERVAVVLGHRFLRRQSARWSEGKPTGFRRPFVVAAHHAEWGADLARQAGASRRTVELIFRHHDPGPGGDPQLAALQAADEAI